MPTPSVEARRKAIRARLSELTARHSQAEIARKTGIPRNKVNRYVHGTRIPCEFAAALVDGMGVSPEWFLTGQGAVNVADVAPDTVRVAGNLLELIRAMAAVEHMQLGALLGKHHLRVLRDLSDALSRYESLREQLNTRSTPVMRRALNELRDALEDRDLDRAGQLCRTAEQLARLCDDPGLTLELAVLHGRLALMNADLKGALDQARRSATLALHSGGDLGSGELEALAGTVEALMRMGRVGEARRIAEAALVLASGRARLLEPTSKLTAELAAIQIHTGELKAGLQVLAGMCGALEGRAGARVDAIFVRALLLSGSLDVESAVKFKRDSSDKATFIVAFAAFHEEPQALEHALAYWRRVHDLRDEDDERMPYWHGRTLLHALNGDSARIKKAAKNVLEAKPEAHEMLLDWRSIMGAQFFRLIGKEAEARRYFRKACRSVASMPEWFDMGVIWQARHMRNAIELGSGAQQQQARDFFQRHVELGYYCFAKL
jgi:tetratricopeptide (TPR) repeat protein